LTSASRGIDIPVHARPCWEHDLASLPESESARERERERAGEWWREIGDERERERATGCVRWFCVGVILHECENYTVPRCR